MPTWPLMLSQWMNEWWPCLELVMKLIVPLTVITLVSPHRRLVNQAVDVSCSTKQLVVELNHTKAHITQTTQTRPPHMDTHRSLQSQPYSGESKAATRDPWRHATEMSFCPFLFWLIGECLIVCEVLFHTPPKASTSDFTLRITCAHFAQGLSWPVLF